MDAEPSAEQGAIMTRDDVLHQLYEDLWYELDATQAEGTAATVERESSICAAIYNLGNAASPPEARMGRFLPSTAQFVEEHELETGKDGVIARKARDTVTGETVVLKTLHHPNPDEPPTVSILREACFMAICRGHPSLVNLCAVGRDPHTGEYCLVTEHVGPSLEDVLVDQRGGKPFSEREVRRMMRRILSGAKAMHDRGVVHRDINLSSILVADGGNSSSVVKIADFGEATSISSVDWHPDFDAALSYSAPECLARPPPAGANTAAAMDSWSMGCLMLELLAGEDVFEVELGGDEEDTLRRIDDVMGLSDETIMEPAVDVELSPEVQHYRAQWRGISRLRDLVPRQVLSHDGFEVLQGLLMYSPRARLTAADALQLPWFTNNTDDSPFPAVSISCWVFIAGLALLFLMVFAFLRRC
ncbi:hypothetical protein QOZ80_6BG0502780 [Eleusine coracana subsp. coracana]|nr:hypothetical protein QOZ80_6BG0502780 [Eleusine coracana subsp. coracana]